MSKGRVDQWTTTYTSYRTQPQTLSPNAFLLRCSNYLSACDQAVKEAAYTSLIRPLIEYSSSAWDPHTEQLITEVEKIQHRAACFVLSDCKSYEPGSIVNDVTKTWLDSSKAP